VVNMRDRIKILGALLAIPFLGLGSSQAVAGVVRKKATKKKVKKKAKKKATKKKATKKKATKKKATKKKATKKKAKKKATKKKAKKKVAKTPTKVSEPGTLALMGAGLVVAGAAQKLGRRSKKRV